MYVLQRHVWSPQRLFQMLEDCLSREKEYWRKIPLLQNSDQLTQICPAHRDYAVAWMSYLNARFNFYPETFFLAVNNLDRFLTTVKSHQKYLKCIAATCLYIASKIIEEEEHIPGALELVEVSQAGCRPGDIIRMEKIISSKLEWSFHIPTALTYMEIFYFFAFLDDVTTTAPFESSLTGKIYSMTKQLRGLTEELQKVVCSYSIAPFRSATIALALLSLRADKLPAKEKWASIVDQMQSKAMIKKADLDQCQDLLRTLLPSKLKNYSTLTNTVYVITAPYKRSSSEDPAISSHQSAPTKRKANEANSNFDAMDCVKKFHQNDEESETMDDGLDSGNTLNSIDEPCITVKEDQTIVHQAEFPYSSPQLEILPSRCERKGPQLADFVKKKHLTYAEIVKLSAMTVCEE